MPALCPTLRALPSRPWSPLSDAEFTALAALLPGSETEPSRGRPPKNLRRTLDAVFWVAASAGPWKNLPAHLGRPGGAHRTLSRWARVGLLQRLLGAATHDAAPAALRRTAYWLARAFRRMARIVGTASLILVRDILRLADACPASPRLLPNRSLSKTERERLKPLETELKIYARRVARMAANPAGYSPEVVEAGIKAARGCMRAIRAGWNQVRLGVCGNRHAWRLK